MELSWKMEMEMEMEMVMEMEAYLFRPKSLLIRILLQ